MKFTILLTLLATLNVSASLYSQDTKLNLSVKDKTLKEVIKLIENQSNFRFFFSDDYLDLNKKVTLSAQDKSINEVLTNLLVDGTVTYKVLENNVVVITPTSAQQAKVTGTITDANSGEVIPGVNVLVKGTTRGVTSDMDGKYSIEVNANDVLVFTYMGYLPEEVTFTSQSVLNIMLVPDVKKLDEVVVVGYGVVKKSDLTGSVSSMNATKITEKGTPSVISALQGSIPGVQIQQKSSRAGAEYDIVVRGQNSISGGTSPLYVVDGVITTNIDFLNPQDIERIDVLKDASSTAIYGSRGSRGVVIVQTKSGRTVQEASKTAISYDGYYGISEIARMPNFMDTREWMKYRIANYQYTTDANNDGVLEFTTSDLKNVWMGGITTTNLNDGKGLQPVYSDGKFSGSQYLLNRYLNNETTDWADLVTQKGIQQNHYIDISGSTKDVSYVVGLGYQNETGVFIKDEFERYNLKASLVANLNSKWSTGFNINTAYSTQESGSDNAMLSAFRMSPIVEPYTNGKLDAATNHLEGNIIVVPGKTIENITGADGHKVFENSIGSGGFTSSINPLIDLDNTSNNVRRIVALGSVYLQFAPIKDLVIKTTLSPSVSTYRKGLYKSTMTEGNYDNPLTTAVEANAVANVTDSTYVNYTWDNQVNYKFTIKNDHNIDIMGLFSMYSDNSEQYTTQTQGYNYDYEWYNLGNATVAANTKLTSGYTNSALYSFAARVNYSFRGKYLLTATVRRDGTSILAKGYEYLTFPSASVAWRVSEESFWSSIKNTVSNFKLRASLGYSGNNNINPYQTKSFADRRTNYNFGPTDALGVKIGTLANQKLTWERTRELNFGVDIGFWNNRLDLIVDVYNRKSIDLLQNRTMPLESGVGTMADNCGSVLNKGIEIALNAAIINKNDLKWNVGASFTSNKNTIENLFDITTPGYIYINSNTQKWMVGENINSIYGYVYDGVWTADDIKNAIANKDPRVINASNTVIAREGQARIKDFAGNGIDASDRRIQGHSDPNWTAGFNTMLMYKGFDFSFNIYTAQGMTVFSPFIEEFTNYNDRGRQKLAMDYYIPAGAYMLADDGSFYQQQVANNYQGRPMAYSDNGSKANCGPYWHQSKETAREMPGSWVDASYLKVRNIMLGYTIPKSVTNIFKVNHLRVYCNVLNPFVSTDYEGFDPEWAGASMGKDNGPATITYQFGVNLKF